jgi:hypothetical protein
VKGLVEIDFKWASLRFRGGLPLPDFSDDRSLASVKRNRDILIPIAENRVSGLWDSAGQGGLFSLEPALFPARAIPEFATF